MKSLKKLQKKQDMEKTSSSFFHISQAVSKSLEYIDGRRKGKIKSLDSGFSKLNDTFIEGIEWNKIITIAGLSGSGKSLLCEQLKRNFCDLNDGFDVLSFEFEMPSTEQVIRNLSAKTGKTLRDLLSVGGKVNDKDFHQMKEVAEDLSKRPIYIVENIVGVQEIVDITMDFLKKRDNNKKGIIVTIDHVLLTKGKQGEDERKVVAELYRTMIGLKKYLISLGVPCLFILLSQLNRDITSTERKLPDLHYPTRNDIFGSSDVFFGSDYVIVIHKPIILNINTYGPKNFPVQTEKGQPLIYLHVLKNRSGDIRILKMYENFKYAKIEESEYETPSV